jgi:hypothetical protein
VVHGNDDTAGAIRSVSRIAEALQWRQVAQPVSVVGAPTSTDIEAVGGLATTLAAVVLGL